MATRMQQRRSPASDWSTANPILAPGEIGFETDTNKFKFGDGVNHWNDLTYFTSATEIQNLIDGAPDLLNTLNELSAAIGDDANFITTVTTSIGTKQDKVTGVSDTEIGYLDGVTSSIQTQLDSKLDSANLTEAAQDAVNTALVAGIGLDKIYNDSSNTITLDIDSTVATKTYADGKASDAESAAAAALSSHESDTTNIHGIADTAELATKAFAASLLTGATKSNITITGDKNGLTITAENGVADSTTDNLTEGTTNKYFTDERAQDAVGNSVGNGLTYTDSSGEIKVDTTVIATKSYADTAASDAAAAIVGSAPATLNTLNELAAALGDDANYASTVTTALGLKAPLASPALTGTPTAPTATAGTNTTQVSTTAFVKTAIDALKTADIEEQTNLYFTDQRAVDAIVYAINHGLDVTLDGGTL